MDFRVIAYDHTCQCHFHKAPIVDIPDKDTQTEYKDGRGPVALSINCLDVK